ncbi:MAG: hypothetical protein ACIALR_04145 [Blastopirellula sp. JB062]
MPIEFLCAACPKKLRVPDASAGKKVKCPGCGQIQKIPAATSDDPLGDVIRDSASIAPSASPKPRKSATSQSGESNPFQSPGASTSSSAYVMPPRRSGGMSPETAKTLLTVSAAILMVVQLINFCFSALMVVGMIFVSTSNRVDNGEQAMVFMMIGLGGVVICVVSIVSIIGLANAALRKSYAFSWVGVILAMIPCALMLNCITMLIAIVSFPVGILAIVMLCLPEGKATFR